MSLDLDGWPDEVVCQNCKRRVTQGRVARYEHDGEHEDCGPREIDEARQREAQRQLHRDTARLLRQMGHAERAAVHDSLAEGRW